MKKNGKTVLVFGTFDGVHEGHRFFLREARKRGEYLIAAVAHDAVVRELKGGLPRQPLADRLAGLHSSGLVDRAIPGDLTVNSWNIIKRCRPSIICIGYDQEQLAESLRVWIRRKNLPITLLPLPAHESHRWHSSRMNGRVVVSTK